MIYPTRRTIIAAAAVAPAALLVGLAFPAYWTGGLALLALLAALALVDSASGAGTRHATVYCEGPGAVGVGDEFRLTAALGFRRHAPGRVQVALEVDGPAEAPEGVRAAARVTDGAGSAAIPIRAVRRGTIRFPNLWIRWQGPLGLVWKQRRMGLDQAVLVTPDIRAVQDKAILFHTRDAMHGLVAHLQIGEGAEFEALADFRQGMDRRSIDWKSSARHMSLLGKEYRTERNNNIIMALDCGRAMSEPVGGVPRIDRAVSAALLTAYAALKGGDRVGLFSFDARPGAASHPVSGPRAFPLLQRVAAGIDYSVRETNYTLGLATLASELSRRSLIVIFTEFADTISAELMLGAVGPLLKRHLVLFVVLRDEELEAFIGARPAEAEDVSRAVTAAALLRERTLVLTRLRHLGVHIVEAAAADAGPALLNAYLDLKRRSLL